MQTRKLGWGILGTGRMARDFAEGLRFVDNVELMAVGSRTSGRSDSFARLTGARRAHDSYESLVSDPNVDVVYVATPHSMHRSNCLLALAAGKAVLCEKPFAMNSTEASEVIDVARQRKLFCMEAMWMHFLPGMRKAMDLIGTGAIGVPRMLMADFGYPTEFDPQGRSFNAELGGGALLDRGVYPLALSWKLFGRPEVVNSIATMTSTGVDEQCAVTIRHHGGAMSVLSATLTGLASNEAVIVGTEARIRVGEPFCRPERLMISRAPMLTTKERPLVRTGFKERLRVNPLARWIRRLLPARGDTLHVPCSGNGFNYEAAEVARCMREGLTESPIWTLEETSGVMQMLDSIRSRWTAQICDEGR